MAHKNHIEFIKSNKDLIKEPILLVGSKLYDYDQYDLKKELNNLGFHNVLGTDISPGNGVDKILDITNPPEEFIKEYHGHFNTIFCMEVLTNVVNPFLAAYNVDKLLAKEGTVFLSECFVRKLSRMPKDYWRFTYDGLKALFPDYLFYDSKVRFSITRQKDAVLKSFNNQFEEILLYEKHREESDIHYILRRINAKFFARGLFKISRWLPEQTIYAVAIKK